MSSKIHFWIYFCTFQETLTILHVTTATTKTFLLDVQNVRKNNSCINKEKFQVNVYYVTLKVNN